LTQLTYSLNIDCNEKEAQIRVMDENLTHLEDVGCYLSYIDSSASAIISSNHTDGDGRTVHHLPGNVSNMRGMFIMLIEKSGYRKKEIHFDILGCLTNESWIAPVANNTKPPFKPYVPLKTNSTFDGNITSNESDSSIGKYVEVCPTSIGTLMFFLGVVYTFNKNSNSKKN